MARFLDSWVLHKTLYDVMLQGGSCVCISCIPTTGNFLPILPFDSLLMEGMNDLEPDESEGEIAFYKSTFQNPDKAIFEEDFWRSVWNDRIQLRIRLERNMSTYSQFFSSLEPKETDAPHVQLLKWFQQDWALQDLKDFFQISHSMVIKLLRDKYKLMEKNHLDVFLPAILEQMEHFHLTGYPMDSRGKEEIEFETVLQINASQFFLSMTGETSIIPDIDSYSQGTKELVVNTSNLEIVLRMMARLGGPTLLDKNWDDSSSPRLHHRRDPYPSFRYDRRIIRLVIARYWADGIIERWIKYKSLKN